MNRLEPDHLQHIADLRRHFGHRYSREVAELYGVPVRTVQRWVYLARKAGLIPDQPKACPTCKRPYEQEP